ncbi:hypothetical protein [Rhizobium sp. BK251]|uniref:hypothetical protein n=1 Tax=Rhizobium sp. BK251 TaxID=2512125 RepID=UPI0010EC2632|nr:hypothetical protein [Rhizobium sp. BK251]TCL76229.1 hypothetical protein EV286_101777 [Rhizobium sp. BK251]
MAILARRFTIITLVAAVFAITFSAVVERAARENAHISYGAMFGCVQPAGGHCAQTL